MLTYDQLVSHLDAEVARFRELGALTDLIQEFPFLDKSRKQCCYSFFFADKMLSVAHVYEDQGSEKPFVAILGGAALGLPKQPYVYAVTANSAADSGQLAVFAKYNPATAEVAVATQTVLPAFVLDGRPGLSHISTQIGFHAKTSWRIGDRLVNGKFDQDSYRGWQRVRSTFLENLRWGGPDPNPTKGRHFNREDAYHLFSIGASSGYR